MARFGLIDSDEEEVSDGESSSSQHSLLEEEEEGGVGRETNQSRTSSSSSDFDFEQEDAPPRASLLSDDDDESQITSEEEEEGEGEGEGEDYSISFATRTPSPPPPTTTTRQTRVKRGGGGGETPWAEQLKLEPKRVQVMQASFFGQSSNNPNPTASTPRSTVVQQQQQQQERVISVPTPIIDPQPFRPFRSYHRVALSDSIINDSGGSIIDAGSTLGRSYKIGWGSKGEIVSLESDDVLKISKLRLLEKDKDLDKKRSMRLLQLQLAHTEIYPSCHTDPESCTNPVPFASPLPTLRFHHFDKLFDTTTTTEEEEEEAQLFKLASHLFDEVNDLGHNNKTNLITRLRRKDLLSNWLNNFLLPRVQLKLNNNSNNNSLEKIFLLLTSHSLKLACETSLDSSNLRLASLISQIGTVSSNSTDSQFQTDLEKQLEKWKEFDLTSLVSKEIVKIYELLSGNLENSNVLQGVEWKAAFAMVLWYSRHDEAQREEEQEEEVSKAIRIYENSWTRSNNRVAPPLPSYLTTTTTTMTTTNTTTDGPLDPIYHLIKLYTLPTHSLEESLSPLNFGNCSTDYRLPWHLYLMFSRVLRKRDFEDRLSLDDLDDLDDDDDDDMDQTRTREGNSVRADQITVSYASQLESLGMWEWSIFVLLHLELEIPRAQAIQTILTRNISSLTPCIDSFLTSTLKIPRFYISKALAVYSQSIGDVFSSYKHLLSSASARGGGEIYKAHELAVKSLVPEAIIRGDKELCRRLLEPFRQDRDDDDDDEEEEEEGEFRGTVQGWDRGGKVYLQYLHTLSLFTSPATLTLTTSQSYLSKTIQSVQQFSSDSQLEIKNKKNKKLKMCIQEMLSRLNSIATTTTSSKSSSVIKPSLLGETEKLVWLQGATKSFLQQSLNKATGVTV